MNGLISCLAVAPGGSHALLDDDRADAGHPHAPTRSPAASFTAVAGSSLVTKSGRWGRWVQVFGGGCVGGAGGGGGRGGSCLLSSWENVGVTGATTVAPAKPIQALVTLHWRRLHTIPGVPTIQGPTLPISSSNLMPLKLQ